MRRLPWFVASCCALVMGSACGLRGGAVSVPPAAPPPDTDSESTPHVPAAAPGDAGFIDRVPHVSLRGLSRGQKEAFLAVINTEPSACGKPHSMAQSVRDDPDCHDSVAIAQFIADAVGAGASTSDIRHDVPWVTEALMPRTIEIEGRPVYGEPEAPVTIVVFADFQCPHCRHEAGKLRQAVDGSGGGVRLVFKHFPLRSHSVAKQAAVASEIAHRQGKFWAMHDQIFANQAELTVPMLSGFAATIGLDVQQFNADLGAALGQDQVEADREEGVALGIEGTPTVFVNGRRKQDLLFGGTLQGWIADALQREG